MATVEQSESNSQPAASEPLPKDDLMAVLEAQPADSTYEELLQALAMKRMIDRGLDDLKSGRTLSHEEVGKRIASW